MSKLFLYYDLIYKLTVKRYSVDYVIYDFSNEIHYELELIIKISRIGKHIQTKFSHKYYDFVGLGIDFTARDVQNDLKKNGLPWEKAKSFDGSCFVSEWIVKSKFDDINNNVNYFIRRYRPII